MSIFIGSVTFERALMWTDKNDPVVIGSSRRTRNANLVTVTGENPSQNYRRARIIFEALPFGDLETLRGYWRAGGTHTANFEGQTGDTHTVRFDPKKGVVGWKHEEFGEETVHAYVEGKDTDIYRGELNLIIES